LSITLLLGVASAGGIIGDNIGFWLGRGLGFRLLCHYGNHIGMPPRRMKLLQFLFLRYGKRIVFVGRFVMILRAWEALLAGANLMPWLRFAGTNAAAVVVWACIWGLSAYLLGHTDVRAIEWVSASVSAVLISLTIGFYVYFRRHEDELEHKADQALPGPLRPRRHVARG
jgi:membrane protein DedA with SNARE-associated domain